MKDPWKVTVKTKTATIECVKDSRVEAWMYGKELEKEYPGATITYDQVK